MSDETMHVGIVSWEGYGDAAREIAASLDGHVDRLTVVYSNKANSVETGAGDWVQFDNADFFGPKLAGLLKATGEDILLVIHADTSTEDWPALVARCRAVFATEPDVGVWAPTVTHTPFTRQMVERYGRNGPETVLLESVIADLIVTAFRGGVVDRLKALDLSMNNIGWGADWFAAAYCFGHHKRVVHDLSIDVSHPKGSGYEHEQAHAQQAAFFAQADPEEAVIIGLMQDLLQTRYRLDWRRNKTKEINQTLRQTKKVAKRAKRVTKRAKGLKVELEALAAERDAWKAAAESGSALSGRALLRALARRVKARLLGRSA